MAIQSRRGNKVNFDKNKMLPGEFGVALDSQEAFICFGAGITKKMATDEDYAKMINDSVTVVTTAASTAVAKSEQAISKANTATDRANTAAATAEGIAENKTGINDNAVGASTTWSSNKINTSLANQIGSASGASINLPNSFNGGLLLKELQGKSTQNGTPTPDAKADIVSVGDNGSVVVRVTGKNLVQNNAVTGTSGGVTFTVNNDGSVVATGTRTGSAVLRLQGDANNVTFIMRKGVTYKSFNRVLSYKDSLGNHNTVPLTGLTPTDDIKVTSFYIEIWESTALPVTIYPMLYVGNETTYEPYKEQLVTIPITQPLRSVGSVYDRIVKKAGECGVERKFGVVVFDGSSDENWNAESTDDASKIRYSIIVPYSKQSDTTNGATSLTNRLVNLASGGTFSKITGYTIGLDKKMYVYTDGSNLPTFKTWLASNPLILQYELTIPTYEILPQSTQDALNKLQSYQGVTNVFTTDPQQPNMIVEYGKTDTSALSIYANNIYDNKIDKSKITNSLAVTEEGFVADPRAIKTVNEKVGNLSNLTTASKTDLVGAVNEVNNNLTTVNPISVNSPYGNIVSGGYLRSGRIVTINFKVNIATEMPSHQGHIGFVPVPSTLSVPLAAMKVDGTPISGFFIGDSNIACINNVAIGTYIISGSYISYS